MEKDKLELILSWITAILFTAGGIFVTKFVNEATGYAIIGIGITILSTCLGLNLIFNSIPHWKLSVQEKKENLAIRLKQFEQKEGFIKQLTTKPTDEDKQEAAEFVSDLKEKAEPVIKKILSGLDSLREPPKV